MIAELKILGLVVTPTTPEFLIRVGRLRELVPDINLSYLAGYKKLNDNEAVAMELRYFTLGDITFTDVIGNNLGHPIYAGFLSLPLAFLAGFFLFTRFANTAAFSSIQGQLGAGASVLMSIKRGFITTPAVAVTGVNAVAARLIVNAVAEIEVVTEIGVLK